MTREAQVTHTEMNSPENKNNYRQLIQSIGDTIKGARNRALIAVNK